MTAYNRTLLPRVLYNIILKTCAVPEWLRGTARAPQRMSLKPLDSRLLQLTQL